MLAASIAAADNPYLQKTLDSHFGSSPDSILIVEVQTGQVLGSVHPEAILRQTHPPGSLIKLFTTIAYEAEHGNTFPTYQCPPTLPRDPNGCWDRAGHGTVDLEKAIAHSCNVYFRQLAQNVAPAVFAETLQRFGVIGDPRSILDQPEDAEHRIMVGSDPAWAVPPILLLRAYCALYNGGRLWSTGAYSPDREVLLPPLALMLRIHAGMRAGAETGTSALARKIAGVPLMGKTGTSLQITDGVPDWNRTQGWWIGLYPADAPQIAVMTYVPTGRGAADAAPLGGRALAEYLKLTHAR